MRQKGPALFKGRHFEAEIIVLCVRWYLRYPLSFRQLEEIMAARNLSVDHVTIWRWVQAYAPELNRRCSRKCGTRIGPYETLGMTPVLTLSPWIALAWNNRELPEVASALQCLLCISRTGRSGATHEEWSARVSPSL